jgi:hypothetical protein
MSSFLSRQKFVSADCKLLVHLNAANDRGMRSNNEMLMDNRVMADPYSLIVSQQSIF